MINSIEHTKAFSQPQANTKKLLDNSENGFHETLNSLINHVDDQIKEADKKSEDFALGRNYDLVDVMVSTEKASLSFQFLLQIRNRLLEGYQEIMRMNF